MNLLGEHLDYNGGPVLPIAIDRRTTVTAHVRPDATVSVTSDAETEPARFPVTTVPGQVGGWAAYVAGVFWALNDGGHQLPGVDLQVSSDVPVGAGLSSSAALECAVAVALRDLAGLDADDLTLARAAQRAENDYVGVPTGAMDQLSSVCGRPGHALLIDTGGPSVRPVPADWEADGVRLAVIDTRASHSLRDGEYAARRRECDRARERLGLRHLAAAGQEDVERLPDPLLRRRVRHVTSEVARVHAAVTALRRRDWSGLGELFSASHTSLRDDFEVSSPELDAAVDAATQAGALGARMTGAGFGGSAIALVPAALVEAVAQRCRRAFAAAGWQRPDVFTVRAAAGAGRKD